MEKIFITGGSGFVGSRLVEILKEKYNAEINVLLRDVSKAARISRYPLKYFNGTIADEPLLDEGIKGCDVVVHCAHDFSSPELNLRAADIIARLCLKHGVKRLVYISTAGVHISEGKPVMNEKSAYNMSWDYSVNKLEVEKKFLEYFQSGGLPVVILRPSIIYGPFAGVWTNGFVREMLDLRVILPFEGNRICNAVYIDDVVQAIIKASDSKQNSAGQAYLVSGAESVTWRNFADAYHKYPGTQEIIYWTNAESDKWYKQERGANANGVKHSIKNDPITFLKTTFLYTIYQKMLGNSFLKEKLLKAKSRIPRPLKYPPPESYESFGSTAQVDIGKIESELGYTPEYSLSKGMKKTLTYLRWYNLNIN